MRHGIRKQKIAEKESSKDLRNSRVANYLDVTGVKEIACYHSQGVGEMEAKTERKKDSGVATRTEGWQLTTEVTLQRKQMKLTYKANPFPGTNERNKLTPEAQPDLYRILWCRSVPLRQYYML